MPPRPCLDCGTPTRHGARCRSCSLAIQRARTAARPAAERAIYGSAAWKRLRTSVLEEAGYRCRYCGRPADTADHVQPVRLRPDLALDAGNVVAACRSCQERRKARGVGTS